jgi:hypothetical protein
MSIDIQKSFSENRNRRLFFLHLIRGALREGRFFLQKVLKNRKKDDIIQKNLLVMGFFRQAI